MLIQPVSTTEETTPMTAVTTSMAVDERLSGLSYKEAVAIGSAQILALLPGISRSGITIVGGLLRGLKHDEAARFAFLLATPAILGAGLFKLPDLLKPEMRGSSGRHWWAAWWPGRRVHLAAVPGAATSKPGR